MQGASVVRKKDTWLRIVQEIQTLKHNEMPMRRLIEQLKQKILGNCYQILYK